MGVLAFAIGIYLVIGALFKPDFFWNSKKAIKLRNSFGDKKAMLIYFAISAVAFAIGIYEFAIN